MWKGDRERKKDKSEEMRRDERGEDKRKGKVRHEACCNF